MLASITPLGERGRRATWGVTVTAFLIGAAGAGAAAGALAGAAGAIVLPAVGAHARLAALAAAVLVAIAFDAAPGAVPGPRRQVNERWLDEYRGWVYGFGYGAQLGLGVSTVVSSSATYVALIAAFLTGDADRGALVLACFGAVRGLTPLLAARVRRPDQLIAAHARLARWRRPAASGALGMLAVILALALVWSVP